MASEEVHSCHADCPCHRGETPPVDFAEVAHEIRTEGPPELSPVPSPEAVQAELTAEDIADLAAGQFYRVVGVEGGLFEETNLHVRDHYQRQAETSVKRVAAEARRAGRVEALTEVRAGISKHRKDFDCINKTSRVAFKAGIDIALLAVDKAEENGLDRVLVDPEGCRQHQVPAGFHCDQPGCSADAEGVGE